jgi:excisionase family DNA binding protein
MDKALTVRQVAEVLGISERTAYFYAKTEAALGAVKIGRHIRVMESDLQAWARSKQLIK